MSETIAMPPLNEAEAKRKPTVYFIDDSATMREVIKIAFRRENINVITCADAASALAQFDENPPDVVITDVIMPDQDGYSVCSQIKQSPELGKTPVILMSGVVNKSVADRAVAVQADELVRKPFQPQELIGRVKNLLGHPTVTASSHSERPAGTPGLSSLFAPPQTPPPARVTSMPAPTSSSVPMPPTGDQRLPESAWPRALAEAFHQQSNPGERQTASTAVPPSPRPGLSAVDAHKLRGEIAHLELLVKKLQTELQIERQYNQALELHVRTLTQIE
jgi:twitching motility two-component system response regulator PilH